MPQSHETSDKFKRGAQKNVEKIAEQLEQLGQLAIVEKFTDEDKDKIFKFLSKSIGDTKKLFDLKKEENTFTLD